MKAKQWEEQLEIPFETAFIKQSPSNRTSYKTNRCVRRLKTQYGPYREGCKSFPMLRLQGKWLLEAGFAANTMVDVEVQECRIVITKAIN